MQRRCQVRRRVGVALVPSQESLGHASTRRIQISNPLSNEMLEVLVRKANILS